MGSTGCAGVTLGLQRASRTSRRLPSSLAEPRRHLQGRRSTPKNGTRFPRFTQRSRRALGGPWLASEHDHPEIVEPRTSIPRHRDHAVEPQTASALRRTLRQPLDRPRTLAGLEASPRSTSTLQGARRHRRGRLRDHTELLVLASTDVSAPKNTSAGHGSASKLG